MTSKNRHSKVSKPIPIGMHHTVCGHEAKDLAKRLTDELASQQSHQGGSLGSQRNNPDHEPRARSFENRDAKAKSKLVGVKVAQDSVLNCTSFPGEHKYYQSLQAVNDQGNVYFVVIRRKCYLCLLLCVMLPSIMLLKNNQH